MVLRYSLHLASVASVHHRHPLLSSQGVDVDLVWVSTAMAFLLGLRKLRQQYILALLLWEDTNTKV